MFMWSQRRQADLCLNSWVLTKSLRLDSETILHVFYYHCYQV